MLDVQVGIAPGLDLDHPQFQVLRVVVLTLKGKRTVLPGNFCAVDRPDAYREAKLRSDRRCAAT